MSEPNIILEVGPITVEEILLPSYLLRCREDEESLTSRYVWVATVAQTGRGRCEVKGYLARDRCSMNLSQRHGVTQVIERLGFSYGEYERRGKDGKSRIAHEITRSGRIAQKLG